MGLKMILDFHMVSELSPVPPSSQLSTAQPGVQDYSPALFAPKTGSTHRERKGVKHCSLLIRHCLTLPQSTRLTTTKTWKSGVKKPQRSLISLLSSEAKGHYCSWPAQVWKHKAKQFIVWAHAETELNPPTYFTQAIKGEPFQSRLMTPSNFHLYQFLLQVCAWRV